MVNSVVTAPSSSTRQGGVAQEGCDGVSIHTRRGDRQDGKGGFEWKVEDSRVGEGKCDEKDNSGWKVESLKKRVKDSASGRKKRIKSSEGGLRSGEEWSEMRGGGVGGNWKRRLEGWGVKKKEER